MDAVQLIFLTTGVDERAYERVSTRRALTGRWSEVVRTRTREGTGTNAQATLGLNIDPTARPPGTSPGR